MQVWRFVICESSNLVKKFKSNSIHIYIHTYIHTVYTIDNLVLFLGIIFPSVFIKYLFSFFSKKYYDLFICQYYLKKPNTKMFAIDINLKIIQIPSFILEYFI